MTKDGYVVPVVISILWCSLALFITLHQVHKYAESHTQVLQKQLDDLHARLERIETTAIHSKDEHDPLPSVRMEDVPKWSSPKRKMMTTSSFGSMHLMAAENPGCYVNCGYRLIRGLDGNNGTCNDCPPNLGPTGPQGTAGLNGSTGPAGPAGLNGSTGPAGPAGLNGSTGPVGSTGPAGPAGPAGLNGTSVNAYGVSGGTVTTDQLYINYAGRPDVRIGLAAPRYLGTNWTLTFPLLPGYAGQCLLTDGTGNTTWSTVIPTSISNLAGTYQYTMPSTAPTASGQVLSVAVGFDNTKTVTSLAWATPVKLFGQTGFVSVGSFDSTATIIAGGLASANFYSTSVQVRLQLFIMDTSGYQIGIRTPVGLATQYSITLPLTAPSYTVPKVMVFAGLTSSTFETPLIDGGSTFGSDVKFGAKDAYNLDFLATNEQAIRILPSGDLSFFAKTAGGTSRIIKFQTGSGGSVSLSLATSAFVNTYLVFPPTAGAANQLLSTDGAAGNLAWTDAALQNGNTLGTSLNIGTNDANTVSIKTANVNRLQVSAAGDVTLRGDGTIARGMSFNNAANTFSITVRSLSTLAANYDLTWPSTQPTVATCLATTSLGIMFWMRVAIHDGNTFGAGQPLIVGTNDLSGLNLETNNVNRVIISATGDMTLRGDATVARNLILNNAANTFGISLKAPDALAASYSLTLPTTVGLADQVFSTNGTSTASWVYAAIQNGNTMAAALSIGTNDANALNLKTNNVNRVIISATGDMTLRGDATVARSLIFNNAANTFGVSLKSPDALGASYSLTLPTTVGLSAQLLSSNGLSSTSWVHAALQNGNTLAADLTIGTNDVNAVNVKTNNSARLVVSSAGDLTLNGDGTVARTLILNSAANTFSVGLRSPDTLAASYSLTLPTTAGLIGQVLSTNGVSLASWVYALTQGGNTLGAAINVGTNDAFDVNVLTSGTSRMTVQSTGEVVIRDSKPIRVNNAANTFYNGFKTQSTQSFSVDYSLPLYVPGVTGYIPITTIVSANQATLFWSSSPMSISSSSSFTSGVNSNFPWILYMTSNTNLPTPGGGTVPSGSRIIPGLTAIVINTGTFTLTPASGTANRICDGKQGGGTNCQAVLAPYTPKTGVSVLVLATINDWWIQ